MFSRLIVWGIFFAAAASAGGVISAGGDKPLDPVWSVSLQGGYASTFQLMLGGTFGEGPDFQNKLTASAGNLLRNGDNLSFYGWSTTDLPGVSPNWQAGFSYKQRILRKGRHAVSLGGGVQRWLFPLVKTGSNDWLATGTVSYATSLRHVPITVSSDSFSLLTSTLPLGSLIYTQIQTQHSLWKRGGYQVSLRHGAMHTYSWGFWGANGNRIVRYGAALAVTRNSTSVEFGCRQQFGLQDKIPYNRFWTVLVTRQMGGKWHARADR